MESEQLRLSFNKFLKLYYDSSKKMYEEMDLKELTGKQFHYLRTIERNKAVTMSFLAEKLELSKPTVTEFIRQFEAKGLVKRSRCHEDQRVVFIKLTEQGKLLASTNKLESERMVKLIQTALSKEEQTMLKQLFDKIGMMHP